MPDEFLARFYQTISFGPGEGFPAEGFRRLFRPDALLLERMESGYVTKTVEGYIREFETAARDYPQLFMEGFAERQTAVEWTEQRGVYFAHSGYEKRYTRNGAPVNEYGVNHFTILAEEGVPRIACVVWE